ncbi:MAG: hypothetical protein M3156_05880 [Thermoproteota archaeon]|nr:hypothetical protein [Thermoproteota archaeon]
MRMWIVDSCHLVVLLYFVLIIINHLVHYLIVIYSSSSTASSAATQKDFDIGEYTGIVALVATAITFFLTYRHGSQSEQTRI